MAVMDRAFPACVPCGGGEQKLMLLTSIGPDSRVPAFFSTSLSRNKDSLTCVVAQEAEGTLAAAGGKMRVPRGVRRSDGWYPGESASLCSSTATMSAAAGTTTLKIITDA